VPLSELMFDLQQKAEMDGRQSEAKVWNVLLAQIWSGLSGYCHAPGDLKEVRSSCFLTCLSQFKRTRSQSWSPAFSQILSQLLYSQPELRPAVLRALKIIVDSNVRLAASNPPATSVNSLSPEEAAQNVAFLSSQAESWLAVLFNVFSSVDSDGRSAVGEIISAWAKIAGEEVCGL
jgi:ribosomal RNA-processing protein 12